MDDFAEHEHPEEANREDQRDDEVVTDSRFLEEEKRIYELLATIKKDQAKFEAIRPTIRLVVLAIKTKLQQENHPESKAMLKRIDKILGYVNDNRAEIPVDENKQLCGADEDTHMSYEAVQEYISNHEGDFTKEEVLNLIKRARVNVMFRYAPIAGLVHKFLTNNDLLKHAELTATENPQNRDALKGMDRELLYESLPQDNVVYWAHLPAELAGAIIQYLQEVINWATMGLGFEKLQALQVIAEKLAGGPYGPLYAIYDQDKNTVTNSVMPTALLDDPDCVEAVITLVGANLLDDLWGPTLETLNTMNIKPGEQVDDYETRIQNAMERLGGLLQWNEDFKRSAEVHIRRYTLRQMQVMIEKGQVPDRFKNDFETLRKEKQKEYDALVKQLEQERAAQSS